MAKNNKTTLIAPHKKEGFRGYTIKELRQQRMITQVRMEFLKERIVNDAHALSNISIIPKSNNKGLNLLSLAGEGLRFLSYADLISLGLSIFKSTRRIYSFFRRKK